MSLLVNVRNVDVQKMIVLLLKEFVSLVKAFVINIVLEELVNLVIINV